MNPRDIRRDETLQHPRSVFQLLRKHVARYTPEEAADLVVKGIIERPSRIATRLGIFSALLNAIAPKAYEVVMNTAFELFPDSAAAKGDKQAIKGETTPSNEQIAFASLMRGVHW